MRASRGDRLTTAATAFASYAALVARCAAGYVPTLRRGDRDQAELLELLERDGHQVWCPA